MLLFIWFLLSIPQDRLICTLWISQPPTPDALIQACGTDVLTGYRLDVLYQGQVICTRPATSLLWVQKECSMPGHMSSYRIDIVKPDQQTIICSVRTFTSDQPSAEDIATQCPEARSTNYQLRFAGSRKPDGEITLCIPPAVEQPRDIITAETHHLLAGKLIWHGYVKAHCPTGALLPSLSPTPCGLEASRSEMIRWQNGMNTEIMSAARQWNVPAMLLKNLIAKETQWWPWTGRHGEHGLIQITEDGAALVLQQYQPGYYQLDPKQRELARYAWLKQLDCEGCDPQESYDHAKQVMNLYAQSLAAYYCTYGDWEKAIEIWNMNHELTDLQS